MRRAESGGGGKRECAKDLNWILCTLKSIATIHSFMNVRTESEIYEKGMQNKMLERNILDLHNRENI